MSRPPSTRPAPPSTPAIGAAPSPWAAGCAVDLPYRPPLDANHMLQFFAYRAIAGVESVDLAQRQYARTVTVHAAGQAHMGWMCAQFLEGHPAVRLTMSNSLAPAFLQVQALCRQLLDLDADPLARQPWRSYATIRAWSQLAAKPAPSNTPTIKVSP